MHRWFSRGSRLARLASASNRFRFLSLTIASLCMLAPAPARASTIIKLTLGGTGPDVAMNASHVFATVDQTGGPSPTGDQLTAIDYTSFLSFIPDVNTPIASFSVAGVTAVGAATPLGGGIVAQNFSGGTYNLYDPADTLLLSGNLSNTFLTGGVTGSLITVTPSTVTGGTLAPLLVANSLTVSFAFTNINGGAGLTIGTDSQVAPFTADAVVTIAADPVPEPASFAALAMLGMALVRRRTRTA